MCPELFSFGPFTLHTYGFMMMVAFAAAILLAVHRAKKAGIDPGKMWDLAMIIMFSSLIGSRLTYVFTHIEEFQGNWFAIINPVQPDGRIGIAGMVLLGGVVTAVVVSIWYLRRKQLDIWTFADVIAPPLALGIGLGRLGCFANGCCFGHPTDCWLGVVFPDHSVAGSYFPGTPVLPTQLFAFIWGVTLFAALWIIDKKKPFTGFTFTLFLIGYAVFRIFNDTLRIYEPGDVLIDIPGLRITFSQGVSSLMIVFAIILILKLKGKKSVNGKQ